MSGSAMLSQMSYAECCKGGLHLGELLNYVCLEKSCREKKNSIGCSVCMEEDHQECRKSPLKYLYKQLSEIVELQVAESKGSSIEESLQSLILSSRQQILESVLSSTNALIAKTKRVQQLCVSIFDGIESQTKQKINTQHSLETILNQLIFASSSALGLQTLMDQLFNLLPDDTFYSTAIQQQSHSHHKTNAHKAAFIDTNTTTGTSANTATSITGNPATTTTTATTTVIQNKEASQPSTSSSTSDYTTSDLKNLQENLLYLFKQISSTVSTKNDAILGQLNLQEKYLLDLHNDQMLVHNLSGKKKLDLTFSTTDKHGSISIIQPSTVKSNTGSSSNYKFALTNSGLPMNCPTKFAFKMKNINSQNWIAIGVALKKVIKAKNYSFSLSLGHGAYMISSNSGSWSHSESGNNNVVKSFDFSYGSIIECLFDPVEGFMHFALKDNPAKKYKLQIDKTKIDEDTYHPCVLFYYPNDEVELMYPYS